MAATFSQILCLPGGDGETSYANNSHFQADVQSRLKPLVEEAIADMCRAGVPGRMTMADLGCSSGPNALALVSVAVDGVRRHHRCQQVSTTEPCRHRPEINVYLNDLPDNDFNLVFKTVPSFLDKHMAAGANGGAGAGDDGPLVLVFGAPGSFYGRLFSAQTLHLVCSSFSIHWLSKVPQELVDGLLTNKGNVFAGKTCTPAVGAAYTNQFERDLKLFLASRAEEIAPGGWMILSLRGRPAMDLSSQDSQSEFAAEVLHDMASRGIVAADDVDSYNVPFYTSCLDELRAAVELDGSFEVVRMESHELVAVTGGDDNDGDVSRSAAMARYLRVVHESMLVQHFKVDGVGDEFARAVEARYIRGMPTSSTRKRVVQIVSLRRKQHPCHRVQ